MGATLDIFGVSFHLYGLVLGLAIVAAFEASLRLAKERGVDKKNVERMFWWVVGGGIIGARVYHVIDKWKEIYSSNIQSIFYIWNGGLGIWGAIGGGILAFSLWYRVCRKRIRTNFWSLLDVMILGVPLGQAIGRWGNFFNNEIVGRNGEPLFLYESILDLVLFGLLLRGRKVFEGKLAGVYLVGYGVIRLFLETLRPEAIVWKIGGVPTAQVISALAILWGVFLISRKRS